MTKQEAYCQYLIDWAQNHCDIGFEGMTPACFDEWLDNEGADDVYDEPGTVPTKPHLGEIEAIINKYGEQIFRMALTLLFDMGYSNIDAESAADMKRQIMAEEQKDMPVITPEFKCHLLDIALELRQFSIWSLLDFIKTRLFIGITA